MSLMTMLRRRTMSDLWTELGLHCKWNLTFRLARLKWIILSMIWLSLHKQQSFSKLHLVQWMCCPWFYKNQKELKNSSWNSAHYWWWNQKRWQGFYQYKPLSKSMVTRAKVQMLLKINNLRKLHYIWVEDNGKLSWRKYWNHTCCFNMP